MEGLISVGIILLIGGTGGFLANKINLPAVTGYIIFGILLGPSFLNMITKYHLESFTPFNSFALGVIAITIGFEIRYDSFRHLKNQVLKSFITENIFTVLITTSLVYLLGLNFELAILLGILAMTTSPTGVMSVIKEYKASGFCTRLMIYQLAMDNILSIILFGLAISIIQSLESIERAFGPVEFMLVFGELFLAMAIGILAGIVLSFIALRTSSNSKMLVVIIGLIAFTTGLAELFDLSPIILNISTGATIANISTKRDRISDILEGIELPVLLVFLTLAGAKLNIGLIPEAGAIALGYIFARSLGKIIGARMGCLLAGFGRSLQENLGYSLMPQAGVAIGLSVVAEQRLDIDVGIVTTVILVAVIVFEVIGPLLVKLSLYNLDEIGKGISDENQNDNEDQNKKEDKSET